MHYNASKYNIGMPELLSDGNYVVHSAAHVSYQSPKYSDMTEVCSTILLLVIPVNYDSVDVFP